MQATQTHRDAARAEKGWFPTTLRERRAATGQLGDKKIIVVYSLGHQDATLAYLLVSLIRHAGWTADRPLTGVLATERREHNVSCITDDD